MCCELNVDAINKLEIEKKFSKVLRVILVVGYGRRSDTIQYQLQRYVMLSLSHAHLLCSTELIAS